MTKSSASAFVYILQRTLIGPSVPASPAGFDVYIVINRGALWLVQTRLLVQAGDDSSEFPYTTTMTLPDCSDLGRPEWL